MTSPRDSAGAERFVAYLIESGLFAAVSEVCLAHFVTPRDVYLDGRGPTTVAARLEVWWRLMTHARKSMSEVAALFDRDATSVLHAMKKLGARAHESGVELNASTVRAVVADAARGAHEGLRRSGARARVRNGA